MSGTVSPTVVCTDTRVEIPAIAEMIEGTLDRASEGLLASGDEPVEKHV